MDSSWTILIWHIEFEKMKGDITEKFRAKDTKNKFIRTVLLREVLKIK